MHENVFWFHEKSSIFQKKHFSCSIHVIEFVTEHYTSCLNEGLRWLQSHRHREKAFHY